MKLKDVIDVADQHYSDGCIGNSYANRLEGIQHDRCGDTLADFIVNEICETFEEENPGSVCGKLDTAILELTAVRDAISQACDKN